MGKSRKNFDQTGKLAKESTRFAIGRATYAKFHTPLIGDDCKSALCNLIDEMKSRPCGTGISTSMIVGHLATRMLKKVHEVSLDVDQLVLEAINLGVQVERARNETPRLTGGRASRKFPSDLEKLKEIATDVTDLINDGMTWTQASDQIAKKFGATGRALRKKLDENGLRPERKKRKKSGN